MKKNSQTQLKVESKASSFPAQLYLFMFWALNLTILAIFLVA